MVGQHKSAHMTLLMYSRKTKAADLMLLIYTSTTVSQSLCAVNTLLHLATDAIIVLLIFKLNKIHLINYTHILDILNISGLKSYNFSDLCIWPFARNTMLAIFIKTSTSLILLVVD